MNTQAQEGKDSGVLAVIVARMHEQRIPRALDLKAKVDQGEVLDDLDIEFLDKVFADASELKPLLARNPQYKDLADRAMGLYREITTKALENENEKKQG